NNEFFEPSSGLIFRYNRPESSQTSRWWGGEPIWVTAIKQGRKASTSFWVGSEAEIGGIRPTHWKKYDGSLRAQDRIDEMIGWLAMPAAERPALVAFYLDETNEAGHRAGPEDPDVAKAVANSDRVVASILAGLRAKNIAANLVIVSDHGMTATHKDRVVILEDYVDRQKLQIDSDGSVVALRPLDGDVDALMKLVERIPHAKAYRAADLPAHFRLTGNPRIAPVWILPEEGWHVETRANFQKLSTRYAPRPYLGGDHGYDPKLRDMHGFFLAHGPAFRAGVELDPVENIHVYNLLCAILGLKPAPNDGDDRLARQTLR
ncbi:MAG TPA: nucleotide pyrophosphatase/phosphodiesterase family protein, partial [Opitutaceae bacterium]